MNDSLERVIRVQRRGSFDLELPPEQAIRLFTAMGEQLWVPNWTPTILGSLPQDAGLVFTTGTGAEYTIWTVIETDHAGGRVRYSRVTPGSRAGLVAVEVTQAAHGSRATVAYDLTALSAAGEAALLAYSPAYFAQMMEDWRGLITGIPADKRARLSSLLV